MQHTPLEELSHPWASMNHETNSYRTLHICPLHSIGTRRHEEQCDHEFLQDIHALILKTALSAVAPLTD